MIRLFSSGHLAVLVRYLDIYLFYVYAVTRCPCGHVCSPVLLRRLQLTQSNALQSEEQPPKLAIIIGDPGPHLRHGFLGP